MLRARTSPAIHESFTRDDEPQGSSNRTPGLLMAYAQIQTVHRETHPRYHAVFLGLQSEDWLPGLRQYQLQCPGEPIVCTPRDLFTPPWVTMILYTHSDERTERCVNPISSPDASRVRPTLPFRTLCRRRACSPDCTLLFARGAVTMSKPVHLPPNRVNSSGWSFGYGRSDAGL